MLNRLGKALKQASQARFLRPFEEKMAEFCAFNRKDVARVLLSKLCNSLILR